MSQSSEKIQIEKSAGGLVIDSGRILMVQVKNLKGEIVWTFPKGHLEGDETDEQAALREVEEETGWKCEIRTPKSGKVFEKVNYMFKRGETLVDKRVVWFLMKPGKITGTADPEEVREVLWVDLKDAGKKIQYPSDVRLLEKLEKVSPAELG